MAALLIAVVSAGGALLLFFRLVGTRQQLRRAAEALAEIRDGNLQRRIVVGQDNPAAELCYLVNEIVRRLEGELERERRSEAGYKRLVTSLSHDLRTPLASLTGYLEAVDTGLVSGEEARAYVGTALDKARDLDHYVDTLFQWLKLESGERPLAPVETDLCELLREGLAGWIGRLERAGFTCRVEIPEGEILAPVDRDAVGRILDNILENAVAHSGGDQVRVALHRRDGFAELVVADNGRGIAEVHSPHVFQRLYKADPARGTKGSGLGLAIVGELARAHGGGVSLEGGEGRGARFTVRLPAKA